MYSGNTMAQFSRKFSCGENAYHVAKYSTNHVKDTAKILSEALHDIPVSATICSVLEHGASVLLVWKWGCTGGITA